MDSAHGFPACVPRSVKQTSLVPESLRCFPRHLDGLQIVCKRSAQRGNRNKLLPLKPARPRGCGAKASEMLQSLSPLLKLAASGLDIYWLL